MRDGRGRLLGCLLFDFATRRLPCRDRFIGWEGQAFRERLHLVVRNARYLLFEWVQVENLASHVLGLAARQLPRDWERWHGWRPVLLETYVNPRQHQAACYRAANWQLAGAASSMCAARAKVGTGVFRRIHAAVLHHAGPEDRSTLWKGHRAFAVDGSKLHLPRALVDEGYRTPSPASHYPQGLLSCLYRIGRRLPLDFDLHAHRNERLAARQHLAALAPGDLVVYDRGYYSFALLHAHVERGMQAVFRLQRNASHCIRDFVTGASRDSILTAEPSETARSQQP